MPKAQAQGTAAETKFETRIDGVRIRFAATLADKIQQTTAALPRMTEDGSGAATVVENAYRWFHNISGIAPTIGFEATGQSARSCEEIVAGPYRSQRGLSTAELVQLTESLEALRVVAQAEIHAMNLDRGSIS
jgi:HPt (histidine-containing phosphotransfer) domain-containing protein